MVSLGDEGGGILICVRRLLASLRVDFEIQLSPLPKQLADGALCIYISLCMYLRDEHGGRRERHCGRNIEDMVIEWYDYVST